MLESVTGYASAKVNIGLRVLPEIKNGYHNIESIFQELSFSDKLTVSFSDKSFNVLCDKMKLPENNTLLLAYNAFYAESKCLQRGVTVQLEKNIPAGGGLGGGSSDAATLVMLLEKLHGYELSFEQKCNIASKIGSDVFFFLLNGEKKAAIVTGRGQNVKPICARTDLFFVLVFPQIVSSTKDAYMLVDKYLASGNIVENYSLAEMESVYNGNVCDWDFKNSFAPPLINVFPEIGMAMSDVKKAGAVFTSLSGSGSTVYGVFLSQKDAESAQRYLTFRWKSCVAFPKM
ncbi:MAG: 4-(cytidine 5'-diphospho)-2-C-methyl-D-erythritol kinase [Treponema sp.]|nr:4-(cytidine 5'-diphospho)-2-C-methyl-D-erythritol kinase [Treponema sp.]